MCCIDNDKGWFILVFMVLFGQLECLVELIYNWDGDDGLFLDSWYFGYLVYCVENIYDMCQKLMDVGVMINCLLCDGYMVFVCSLDNVFIELFQEGDDLLL